MSFTRHNGSGGPSAKAAGSASSAAGQVMSNKSKEAVRHAKGLETLQAELAEEVVRLNAELTTARAEILELRVRLAQADIVFKNNGELFARMLWYRDQLIATQSECKGLSEQVIALEQNCGIWQELTNWHASERVKYQNKMTAYQIASHQARKALAERDARCTELEKQLAAQRKATEFLQALLAIEQGRVACVSVGPRAKQQDADSVAIAPSVLGGQCPRSEATAGPSAAAVAGSASSVAAVSLLSAAANVGGRDHDAVFGAAFS